MAVDAEARRPRPPRRGRPPARPASARFSGQRRAERLVPGPAEALVAPWTWPPCDRPHRHPRTPVAEDTAAGHGPVPRRPLRQPLVGGLGAQGRRCLPRSPLLTHPPTWGPCSLPSSTRGSPPVPAVTFGVPAPHSQVGMLKPGPSSHPPAPPASAAHMCGDAGCRQPGLPRMWGGASLGASRQRGPRVSPQGRPHCAPAWSRRGPPRSGRVRTAARCWGRSRGRRGGRGGTGWAEPVVGPLPRPGDPRAAPRSGLTWAQTKSDWPPQLPAPRLRVPTHGTRGLCLPGTQATSTSALTVQQAWENVSFPPVLLGFP